MVRNPHRLSSTIGKIQLIVLPSEYSNIKGSHNVFPFILCLSHLTVNIMYDPPSVIMITWVAVYFWIFGSKTLD